MEISVGQLADFLQAEVIGDRSVIVRNVRGVEEAEAGDLTFVVDEKYVALLERSKASAVLVRADLEVTCKIPQIRVKDPREALRRLVAAFAPPPITYAPGVHPTAIVAEDAVLGKNVSVQPYAVVEAGVTIGDDVVIGAHCYIGHYTTIGEGSFLYPRVTIRERVVIGKRVIIHPGVVIGADGFGYEQVNGKYEKIPQVGTVVIEDDVEIGANTTIDRARFDKTIVRRGTKIDNLVMIAHNCEVGEDTILCGQVGLSGSAKVGNHVIMAGQSGMVGHIKIHDNIIIGAQCGVTKELVKPGFYIGSPATPHMTYKKRESIVVRLPEIYKRLVALEKEVEELTGRKSGGKESEG
ncbi:MAG: UDP-3-O-(3-hydroxymyristoyl)glucosamine N-acyltransferase [bacterium]|nr:UDP-3-O-(3-hydroxymyristoyl)glucosamine N-acyltransferase [bacterium]